MARKECWFASHPDHLLVCSVRVQCNSVCLHISIDRHDMSSVRQEPRPPDPKQHDSRLPTMIQLTYKRTRKAVLSDSKDPPESPILGGHARKRPTPAQPGTPSPPALSSVKPPAAAASSPTQSTMGNTVSSNTGLREEPNNLPPSEDRKSRSSAFHIPEVNNYGDLLRNLQSKHRHFHVRIEGKGIALQVKQQEHESMRSTLTSLKIPFFTHNPNPSSRQLCVIRGLPTSTSIGDIRQELNDMGIPVLAVEQLKRRGSGAPMPLFQVSTTVSKEGNKLWDIKTLLHCRINIEEPTSTPLPPLCKRCQRPGHTRNFCQLDIRCRQCGAAHDSRECNASEDQRKCANCGANHCASYAACPKYKEYLASTKRTTAASRTATNQDKPEVNHRNPTQHKGQQTPTPNPWMRRLALSFDLPKVLTVPIPAPTKEPHQQKTPVPPLIPTQVILGTKGIARAPPPKPKHQPAKVPHENSRLTTVPKETSTSVNKAPPPPAPSSAVPVANKTNREDSGAITPVEVPLANIHHQQATTTAHASTAPSPSRPGASPPPPSILGLLKSRDLEWLFQAFLSFITELVKLSTGSTTWSNILATVRNPHGSTP